LSVGAKSGRAYRGFMLYCLPDDLAPPGMLRRQEEKPGLFRRLAFCVAVPQFVMEISNRMFHAEVSLETKASRHTLNTKGREFYETS
jgi:hypothetical protein